MAIHVVTGGSGFVGNGVVYALLEKGHQVRVVDLLVPLKPDSRVEYFQGSILDHELLRHVCKNANTVHHVAAAVPLVAQKKIFIETNVEGTRLVCQFAGEAAVQHFNFISSSAVYGKVKPPDCPIKEELDCAPFEDYGKSKLLAEKIVLSEGKQKNKMTRTILRPRTVLGAGRVGIFDLLFNWIQFEKNIYIIGDGSNKMQLVHVKDLAHASVLCAETRTEGVFNIGTNKFGTLQEVILNLCANVGSRSKIKSIPISFAEAALFALEKAKLSPFSSWHYHMLHSDFYFDTSRFEKAFDWKPLYSNDEMLLDSYNWYIQHKNLFTSTGSIHQRSLKKGILHLFMK